MDIGSERTYPGGKEQKYTLSDEEREFFLATYDGSTAAIDEIQDRLHWPRYAINNLAAQSGLTRPRERPWRFDEISYLCAHRNESVASIATVLHRSRMSVRIKLTRLPDESTGHYNLSQVCYFLGSNVRDVKRWVQDGKLCASRRVFNPDDYEWSFDPRDIREFLLMHSCEIRSPARIDVQWLIYLLVDGDIGN